MTTSTRSGQPPRPTASDLFTPWVEHFTSNRALQRRVEEGVDWDAAVPATLTARDRIALVGSLQRFALGEDGDGAHLLGKARDAGDPSYVHALELLVAEEQRHAALFRRGLGHLGAPSLTGHWSDVAFTAVRRALGLRTEIALFLVAETVAMDYFEALARYAPDPVVRGIGRRVALDEVNHVRFQVDRMHLALARVPTPVRSLVRGVWTLAAAGAATVLVVDHAASLRAVGLSPVGAWLGGMRSFRNASRAAVTGDVTGLPGEPDRRPDAASPQPRRNPALLLGPLADPVRALALGPDDADAHAGRGRPAA